MTAALPPVPLAKRGLTLLTVCLGAFMATLDTSIVNIALPQMARELDTSLATISWVMLAYLIANASLLLSTSRLGDMLAPGRLFLAGLLLFSLASTACGFFTHIWPLILGRALQGASASLMLGVAPKIITLSYREGERGLAFGLFSTAFAAGVSVGAPLGALITSAWGWPWVFFIKLPLGLATLAIGGGLLRLRPAGETKPLGFDWPGGVLFTLCLSLLIWALTQVRTQGWLDLPALAALGGAGLSFMLLLILEQYQAAPLLPRALWASRSFTLGALAVVLTFAALMGTFFLLPFYLEEIFQLPPASVGWLLAILSFSNALVSPLGGWCADRWNNLLVLRAGAGLLLLGLAALVWVGPASSVSLLAAVFMITGLGFGLFQAPNLNEMLQGVRPHMLGLAAGTNAVLKNLGALLGIALMVTMVALGDRQQASLKAAPCLGWPCYQRAFALAVALSGLNLALNLVPRHQSRA